MLRRAGIEAEIEYESAGFFPRAVDASNCAHGRPPFCGRFAYLAVLLDAYSRKVIGWALGTHATTALCVEVLRQALASRTPAPGVLHHSDQEVQYASSEYTTWLQAHGAVLSMSRTGHPTDNAQVESFFKTLKHEEVYLNAYEDIADAWKRISHFLEAVYNDQPLHSALDYLPPNEFEAQQSDPE